MISDQLKLLSFVSILISVGLIWSCSVPIYTSNNLIATKASHKKIAIIPCVVNFGTKFAPKKATSEEIQKLREDKGNEFQNLLYAALSKDQRKGKLTVSLQEVATTNRLLASISYSTISSVKSDSLTKLLDVDAVVRGDLYMDRHMSEAATVVAKTLIPLYTSNDKFNYNIHIDDRSTGEILWALKRDTHPSPSIESDDSDDPMIKLVRSIRKYFPYKKK